MNLDHHKEWINKFQTTRHTHTTTTRSSSFPLGFGDIKTSCSMLFTGLPFPDRPPTTEGLVLKVWFVDQLHISMLIFNHIQCVFLIIYTLGPHDYRKLWLWFVVRFRSDSRPLPIFPKTSRAFRVIVILSFVKTGPTSSKPLLFCWICLEPGKDTGIV